MNSALNLHLTKYKSPRAETLRNKAKQDEMSAALAAELALIRRRRQLARFRRWVLWPKFVWRW